MQRRPGGKRRSAAKGASAPVRATDCPCLVHDDRKNDMPMAMHGTYSAPRRLRSGAGTFRLVRLVGTGGKMTTTDLEPGTWTAASGGMPLPAATTAAGRPSPSPRGPDLTVIVVSYNTRALTLKCLETLYSNTAVPFRCVLWDNDSEDGSATAVAAAFPQVDVVASRDNLGFARANNVVAEGADTEWLLLLNPDTEVHPGAIDALMAFSMAHPEAGITGGRTVFPDGSLNIASCWMRITPWSAFCMATGLTTVFRGSALFNPEGMGSWQRDTVREVDIVVGCFLMIRRSLWNELGGFDLRYFMYGEEADLCLRARAKGYRPMITPEAQIMHLVGASSGKVANKVMMVAKSRVTLIRDHWPAALVPLGVGLMWLWAGTRVAAALALALAGRGAALEKWRLIWAGRRDWLAGYRA
ncbi:glycosyltransferase family 2 protein [Frigidibacter sp. MR17.14]|uniref:glycosyltransferase family 2 protein n=1 Tax=Frigidibacter sp. MR17.14 TaxID=3126509 RepID=UPI003012D563